jgi:hypothetical protein
MTPHQEPMNDAALERELERLAGVEPSADFQARIRARVMTEAMAPPGAGLWGAWVARGAVLTAAGIVLLMVIGRMGPAPRSSAGVSAVAPAPSSQPAPVLERRPSPATHIAPAATRVASTHRPRGSGAPPVRHELELESASPAPQDPFKDVQLSANELKALRQIAALGVRDPDGEEERSDTKPPAAVADLVITPISIDPIHVTTIEGAAE